jgi:hypothetical protein
MQLFEETAPAANKKIMFCLVLVFSMRDMKLALADASACAPPTDGDRIKL